MPGQYWGVLTFPPPELRADHPSSGREVIASDCAWRHRWESWPSSWPDLLAASGGQPSLTVVYAVARRLHFHFAHEALHDFASAALVSFPDDVFLCQLRDAARAVLGDPEAWESLLRAAAGGNPKVQHILLTSAFTAMAVPERVLSEALEVSAHLTSTGDPVAAYRHVSLLRRTGRLQEAFVACEAACLLAAQAGPHLGEHLSERLLVERLLVTAALDRLAAPSWRA